MAPDPDPDRRAESDPAPDPDRRADPAPEPDGRAESGPDREPQPDPDRAAEREPAADGGGEPVAPAKPWPDGPIDGGLLVRADAAVTGLFAVSAVAAAAWAHPATAYPAAVLAGLLAIAGCIAFGWGYLVAVRRSRHDAIDLAGLFWLKGSAPPAARRPLIGLLWAQIVVALVVASIRPFTVLAFCVLAPLWGLGVVTLWAAKHGRFPAKS
ncbi:MAG: hypothetical protein JWN46_1289 [Acidimicrobiales bacterium]|nr:hypothetical protein [Acidimicrobiales bacterium]